MSAHNHLSNRTSKVEEVLAFKGTDLAFWNKLPGIWTGPVANLLQILAYFSTDQNLDLTGWDTKWTFWTLQLLRDLWIEVIPKAFLCDLPHQDSPGSTVTTINSLTWATCDMHNMLKCSDYSCRLIYRSNCTTNRCLKIRRMVPIPIVWIMIPGDIHAARRGNL